LLHISGQNNIKSRPPDGRAANNLESFLSATGWPSGEVHRSPYSFAPPPFDDLAFFD